MKKMFARKGSPSPIPECIVAEGVTSLVLNRRKLSWDDLTGDLSGVLSHARLAAMGGILFKTHFASGVLHIGLIPNFYEGERGYHHSIHLEAEDELTIIGGISAQRELSMMFKCRDLTDAKREHLKRTYRITARLVRAVTETGSITLEWVTPHLIEATGLAGEVPETLDELCRLGFSG